MANCKLSAIGFQLSALGFRRVAVAESRYRSLTVTAQYAAAYRNGTAYRNEAAYRAATVRERYVSTAYRNGTAYRNEAAYRAAAVRERYVSTDFSLQAKGMRHWATDSRTSLRNCHA